MIKRMLTGKFLSQFFAHLSQLRSGLFWSMEIIAKGGLVCFISFLVNPSTISLILQKSSQSQRLVGPEVMHGREVKPDHR